MFFIHLLNLLSLSLSQTFYFFFTSKSSHDFFPANFLNLIFPGFLIESSYFFVRHRISTEIASLSAQQNVGVLQKKRSNEVLFPQCNPMPDEISADLNQHSNRWLLLLPIDWHVTFI
jgi:hypothetical protein